MHLKLVIGLLSLLNITKVIDAQVLSDSKSSLAQFFENLNPVWRHHRARLRPFLSSLGSPMVSVRGVRSINFQDQINLCGIDDEVLSCIGLDPFLFLYFLYYFL
jgi:hypothetical protein